MDGDKLEKAYQELELELLQQPDNAILVYYQAVILAKKHHQKRMQYEAMTGKAFRT